MPREAYGEDYPLEDRKATEWVDLMFRMEDLIGEWHRAITEWARPDYDGDDLDSRLNQTERRIANVAHEMVRREKLRGRRRLD